MHTEVAYNVEQMTASCNMNIYTYTHIHTYIHTEVAYNVELTVDQMREACNMNDKCRDSSRLLFGAKQTGQTSLKVFICMYVCIRVCV